MCRISRYVHNGLRGVGDCTLLQGCQVQLCMCTKLARRSLAGENVLLELYSHYKDNPRMSCCRCRVTAMMMSHLMVKRLRLVS